jgi:hypothetical protein
MSGGVEDLIHLEAPSREAVESLECSPTKQARDMKLQAVGKFRLAYRKK